ncbi:MAG: FAD-dependent oxidoreductase, partial [Bacteroidia bacterium]|nr:FAD-dependent oxidoreductase [Bacteroidia bacterium]
DYEMVNRLTRIYYRNRFFYYPIRLLNALYNLGPLEAIHCLVSFIIQQGKPLPQDDASFEDWVSSRFGKRLYEIFFKTYSEKLWGIPCTELDADFATQRIKKLSLWEAVWNAITSGKGNKHKTLVDQFAYPIGGSGMVYERMAKLFVEKGGNLFLNTPVQQVISENFTVQGLVVNQEIRSYEHVISSMPLTLLVEKLPEITPEIRSFNQKLRFRNTILVFCKVEATNLFPDNWLYIHIPELKTGRITNFRNWVPQLYGQEKSSILALEFWCNDEDDFWNWNNQKLGELAIQELKQTGLIKNYPVSETKVIRIPRCYPVYSRGYKKHLKPIEEFLQKYQNIQFIGRYGAFKYNNQDHSILMGMLAAENVNGANHNLWEINTDYENYQESSRITETGLVSN